MKKIEVTKISVKSSKIPKSFSGCKILHLSDLHGNVGEEQQEVLLRMAKTINPEYIFITGDLIDEHCRKIEECAVYIQRLRAVAPIYYVTGNHEWISNDRTQLLKILETENVCVLQDRVVEIEREGERIQIVGMNDPYCLPGKKTISYQRISTGAFLERFIEVNRKRRREEYTMLLSHRPELFHFYMKSGVDLVFSGHAHGGQFRIPGKGGLLAPHQGFFPKYTEGLICEKNTKMIVSRGLGDSGFPFRIGNPYEMIEVCLESKVN